MLADNHVSNTDGLLNNKHLVRVLYKGKQMMYSNKLVASLKANGRILREFKDTVYVPFGSEYSILLKNLHTTRCVVNVFIDGDNMVPGGLVLNAGQEINLERSIRNGNLNEGNKFKFIERTGNIEEHRGVKLEDGLIRIEFQYEMPRPVINITDQYWNKPPQWTSTPYYGPFYGNSGITGSTGDRFSVSASGASYSTNVNGVMRGVDFSKGEAVKAAAADMINQVAPNTSELHDGMATCDSYLNETGITVPGSKSEQKFTSVTMGAMEPEKYNMVFKILGELGQNKVEKPVTVKHKPKCVTCGKQNKATAKFCTECGTSLELYFTPTNPRSGRKENF